MGWSEYEFELFREHHTLTNGTHLNESLADWLRKFLKEFSPFISEIMPQLHHQVASVLSLFEGIYLCSHMLPGMKIKSSTNHFWWPPWQINPFSVLWKCQCCWGLKNQEVYIKEKVSGVPWQQISQSTLNAGNYCNKYHALIDVSYV